MMLLKMTQFRTKNSWVFSQSLLALDDAQNHKRNNEDKLLYSKVRMNYLLSFSDYIINVVRVGSSSAIIEVFKDIMPKLFVEEQCLVFVGRSCALLPYV